MNFVYPHRYKDSTPSLDDFVTEWTVSASDEVTLPLDGGKSYNFNIDWGDGTPIQAVSTYNDPNATHTYISGGIYEQRIDGVCESWTVDNVGSIDQKITKVIQWGNVGLKEINFHGCTNLSVVATDILDTSQFISLSKLFYFCSSIGVVPNINLWDISNVTNLNQCFARSNFNGDVSDWDTSKVINMFSVFFFCGAFNGDISLWDVSKVTDFSTMFRSATNFNSDITGWTLNNISNINLSGMFRTASSFVRDISVWNTSKVTNMNSTFSACNFNKDLDNWDVSNVTNMGSMFSFSNYNHQNITWDTSKVTSMAGMFQSNISFNQDISGWDVSKVTNFSSMFNNCINFNQNINAWVTTELLLMSLMFSQADDFNQPVSNWDVSKVTNMSGAFDRCFVFNQDLSAWDVSSVTVDMLIFTKTTPFNTINYDLLLIAWSVLILQSGITLEMDNVKYTETSVDSGITDGVATNKLIDAGQNFITTVSVDDIAHNTSDGTFAKITAIDDNENLSLDEDIFISGKNYVIQSSNAAKARYNMISTHGWTITDGGAI